MRTYAVHCRRSDWGPLVVIDGFSTRDSADEFASDPRKSRYCKWISEEDAALLFSDYAREVVATWRP